MINLIFFIFQIVLIYFISRRATNELFYLLRKNINDDKIVFSLVSLIYLPGTIIHEFSHFFMATVLFLKVRDLRIIPHFEKNHIKLGSVIYEKKDFLRGIVVGIAPVIVGILFFLVLAYSKIFPSTNLFLNILMIYVLFTITSTMFSSKQDLVDLVFIIPVLVIIIGIIYVFDIKFDLILQNKIIMDKIIYYVQSINIYFFLSILINIMFIVIFKSLTKIIKK